MEQGKIHRPEWEHQVKKTAQFAWGRIKGGGGWWWWWGDKHIKGGNQDELRALLWGRPTLRTWGCTFLYLPYTILSSRWAITLVCHFRFLLQQDRTEEITHSPDKNLLINLVNLRCTFLEMSLLKVYKALIRLVSGHSPSPFWCLCQKLPLSLFTSIKLWYTKALEWPRLVPGPKAKSSSLEITICHHSL